MPPKDRPGFTRIGLRPALRGHGPRTEHVQCLFESRDAFRQRLLVRELIQAHAAAFLLGVARQAVLGEERLDGALIFRPIGRRTRTGGRAAARGQSQYKKGA
jgi:hypothetical protein